MSPYSRPGTETRATAQPESIKGGKYEQNIMRHGRGVWLADRIPCTDGITESGVVSRRLERITHWQPRRTSARPI